MTLQEFIDFEQYVRCFTFGKTDIMPVALRPASERRYLVDHKYLTPELGARVIVKDAQTINQALGYEMNTIEFAVQDGVPYAIDFLNPAPDFERDRITPFYFDWCVDKMAALVIDRALSRQPLTNPWPRWEQMTGLGASAGVIGQPAPAPSVPVFRRTVPRVHRNRRHRLLARPVEARRRADARSLPSSSPPTAGGASVFRRPHPLSVPASVLPGRRRRSRWSRRVSETSPGWASASRSAGLERPDAGRRRRR